MSDHIFVSSEQNSDLAGHMSFQKKKVIYSLVSHELSFQSLILHSSKARFKRHILHVPNLMQMRENNRFFSFALDAAHVKCDVYNGP